MKTSRILVLCLIGLAGTTGGLQLYRKGKRVEEVSEDEDDEPGEPVTGRSTVPRFHGVGYSSSRLQRSRISTRGGFGSTAHGFHVGG